MNRNFVIIGLLALFSLSALANVQQENSSSVQTGQSEEDLRAKNVASLTTTDLLNSQDFAPKTDSALNKRSRIANLAKNPKTDMRTSSAAGKSDVQNLIGIAKNLTKLDDPGSAVMIPANQIVATNVKSETTSPLSISTGRVDIDQLVAESAARNGIDPRLMMAVMKQESSFNARATSYKGARGLMQLMPATAARFGVRDIYDPAQNIEGGARYLRFLLDTFNGDIELALAGYNAGEHAVARYGNRIPPYQETQDYVRKISAHYVRLSNGELVRRNVSEPKIATKRIESEVITVGQTMRQY